MPIWGWRMIERVLFSVLALVILPAAAQADAWSAFKARCLDPFEIQSPPVVAGLSGAVLANGDEAYALPEGREMRVENAPPDGNLACAVIDPSGAAATGFQEWIAAAVAEERYHAVQPGLWRSDTWIEPVLAIEERIINGTRILRIVETQLES